MLKEKFIFTISLLGTTIQYGGMKERSVFRSSRVNYAYIASDQNKFILSDLPITVNLSKCEKALYFLYKSKKHLMAAFIKMNCSWTLVSLSTLLLLSLTLLM